MITNSYDDVVGDDAEKDNFSSAVSSSIARQLEISLDDVVVTDVVPGSIIITVALLSEEITSALG